MARLRGKVLEQFVAAQAAEGKTAREISDAAGVTRQAVYQAAERCGVTLPSAFTRLRKAETEPVVTVAASSEMAAAADLMARGWSVYAPISRGHGGHDLIACRDDDVRTLEVKSGVRLPSGDIEFPEQMSGSQHSAVVLFDEAVVFIPPLPD